MTLDLDSLLNMPALFPVLHDEELSYHAWNVLDALRSTVLEAKQFAAVCVANKAPYAFTVEQLIRRRCELLGIARGALWLDSSSLNYSEYQYLMQYYLASANELRFLILNYLERHL